MKASDPTDADRKLRREILDLIGRHMQPDTQERALAIAAQIVGQFIAVQDQRRMTPDMAMEIVYANMQSGNRQIVNNIMRTKGSA